ncbi:ABC transporter substrate-binding protein [Paracoccus contaminans]|uniref:Amino acid ABC transporter substrate-binding protein n=1 Tax=Paracoccus contaminans TaxID=1945662 RepID=A0A1W6CXS8_9RHOB|nr:ABC transporter substrate-binding protein [Paracoccus contaminans]ARJ69660.1 amino acid ABC transporter substrate-binding protein [Paracoccus contaminans]
MVTAGPVTRRGAIGAAVGAAMLAGAPARLRASAGGPVRLAAIDWAMLETAAAIGHMPAAACELLRYRVEAVTPMIPDGVVDLGLRGAPNVELLQLVRPALILSSPYYAGNEARFRRIAPVLSLSFFEPGVPPLPRALAALDILARAVGDPAAGARAQAEAEARLDRLRRRLSAAADRPVAIVSIGDARHMRVFGDDSLFGSALARLGLTNAWTGATRFSFLAPVPIEALADLPEARLVIMGQVPPEARTGLDRSVLWRRLPQVAAGRVHQLPEVNAFGGAPAALRFAEALAGALVPA